MSSQDWYKPRAADYQCNQHPKILRELSRNLAIHTGMTEENTKHLIDRLRHLSTCCREPEQITLMRLHPGVKQTTKPTELELAAMDEDNRKRLSLQERQHARRCD